MSNRKCFYIKVTQDKYELPLYVAGNAQELAEYEGVSTNTIYSSICHYEHGRVKSSPYRRVYDEE